MNAKVMIALGGCIVGLVSGARATAAPHLVLVSHNTTNAFLVANNMQSAVIGITGFSAGDNFYGLYGTPNNPWIVATTGSTFFNVDSNPPHFDGLSQWTASALSAPPNGGFDSGVLANPTTNALGQIQATGGSNPIGFALFAQGQNSGPGDDVIWQTLNTNGVAVPGTAQLLRLTWSASHSAAFSAAMFTRGINPQEFNVSITIPAVPAAGELPLLALAGMIGRRRHRRVLE